jgi:hypothetical protein
MPTCRRDDEFKPWRIVRHGGTWCDPNRRRPSKLATVYKSSRKQGGIVRGVAANRSEIVENA